MDTADTGQYLCVHVSDKDQQAFQVSGLFSFMTALAICRIWCNLQYYFLVTQYS